MKYLHTLFLLIFSIFSFLNANDNNLNKISLQLQWKHQFEFAGFYMAKEKGYYKDVGLDVDIKEFDFGINIVDDVNTGKTTFGLSYPTVVLERSKGKDIVLLSAILQSSPHALITLESSGINSIKDFKTKSIMINENAESTAPFVSMLQSNQVSFDDLTIKPHSFNIDDLINKKVDISTIFISNEPFILKEKGIKYKIWDPKDYGFDFYDVILFTSSKIVENNPLMAKSFNDASLKGWSYAFSNIEETVDLILKKYNTQGKSKEALLFEAKELKKLAYYKTDKIGKIDKNNIQRIFDIYNLLGLTKNKIDLEKFIFASEELFSKKEKGYLKNNHFNIYINNWHPFSSFNSDNGTFNGLSIDFWQKISETIEIKHSKKYVNSFLEILENSKNDPNAIALSLSYSKNRAEYGAFSKPYVSYPIAIATNIKEDYIIDLASLKGKKVAVGKNFSAHKLLLKHYPEIDFVPVSNTTEAINLLANKEVFAAADILPTLSYYLNKHAYTNLKISGTSEFKLDVRIMVNKENKQLIPILNKAIDSISIDDKKLINNKWTQFKRHIEKIDYVFLGMVIVPIILILLFVLILYYNQKQHIKELKKKEKYIQKQHIQLVEQTKMASLGEMIGNIAHQWRQPLSTISTVASGVKLNQELGILNQKELPRNMNLIVENAQYLSNTIDTFRNFIKNEEVEKKQKIEEEINQAIGIINTTLENNFIDLKDNIDYEKSTKLYMKTGELTQVIINIVNNAKDILLERKITNPFIELNLQKQQNIVLITIEDNAGGIDNDVIPHIFEPYFTTKHQSQGTGLGLYMSYKIVCESLRGKIYVQNTNIGAKFFIEIDLNKNKDK